jgi:hypothetical protein
MRDAQGELRRVKATFRRSAMIGNPSTAMNKSAVTFASFSSSNSSVVAARSDLPLSGF